MAVMRSLFIRLLDFDERFVKKFFYYMPLKPGHAYKGIVKEGQEGGGCPSDKSNTQFLLDQISIAFLGVQWTSTSPPSKRTSTPLLPLHTESNGRTVKLGVRREENSFDLPLYRSPKSRRGVTVKKNVCNEACTVERFDILCIFYCRYSSMKCCRGRTLLRWGQTDGEDTTPCKMFFTPHPIKGFLWGGSIEGPKRNKWKGLVCQRIGRIG
ncbi:hypothetical protein CDAR_316641 [Caerostris darwini]|uniref:Uncharacterized protein n=1 Tax=Caerostris darwini TaxID=1538125 RepID=A0AAV4UJ24_9ARAC|nr:hypothetical protein CDAR_316641 [Caerostris darwini]